MDARNRDRRSQHGGNLKLVRIGQVVAEKIGRIVAAAHSAKLARTIQFIAHGAQDHVVVRVIGFLRQQQRSGSGQQNKERRGNA